MEIYTLEIYFCLLFYVTSSNSLFNAWHLSILMALGVKRLLLQVLLREKNTICEHNCEYLRIGTRMGYMSLFCKRFMHYFVFDIIVMLRRWYFLNEYTS